MKRFIPFFITIFTALTACTEYHNFERRLSVADTLMNEQPDSAYRMLCEMNEEAVSMPDAQRMQHLLLRSNAQNKAYVNFTSDSIGNLLVEYYDQYGTPNERMLAHYIRGCAYRDMGDQPASLRCYNDAVAAADTSRADCNYEQLSIIYGQIADIFDRRAMPDNAIEAYEMAERFAWTAKDTIKVYTLWGNKSNALINKGEIKEALRIKETAAEGFRNMGDFQKAARILGLCIKWYAQQGEFDKAKAAMDEYENHSGYFLGNGETKPGKEGYYSIKGTYFLQKGELDSAEHYFRKLLCKGSSRNNQHLATWGLTQLYYGKMPLDSIGKYALQTLAHNDTLYNIAAAQNLQNVQAQYNYTRHLETAHRKELEAKDARYRLLLLGSTCMLAITLLALLVLWLRKQNQKKQQELSLANKANAQLHSQIQVNAQTIEELNGLIEEKRGIIHSLNQQLNLQAIDVNHYRQQTETIHALNEKIAHYESSMMNRINTNLMHQLHEEPSIRLLFQRLKSKAQQPTSDEWAAACATTEKYYPAMCDIKANPKISPLEYHICILTKLRFEIADIVLLTGSDNSSITAKRKRMLPKLFNCTGSAKEFDALILAL
ncbi:MAG: hypothetical protein IKU85_09610 [Bacteroidaceae bacterium]|nr:hypothetical protein [Bacteroidaceae bacterium]